MISFLSPHAGPIEDETPPGTDFGLGDIGMEDTTVDGTAAS